MDNPFEAILEKLNNIESKILTRSDIITTVSYLKIDKAAAFLSTTPNALRVLAAKEQIPHIKKQGKLYFLYSELIEWMESGRVQPIGEVPEESLLQNKKRLQS